MPDHDIEIVVHCWNYSRLLAYQLSSLAMYPPSHTVRYRLFYCPDDLETVARLKWFVKNVRWPETIRIAPHATRRKWLLRRAIGRNKAAKETRAAMVWFSDCDHLFGSGCIDAAIHLFQPDRIMCFPHNLLKCEPERGDEYVRAVDAYKLYAVNPDHFRPVHQARAVGGTQIVSGDTARTRGYLDGISKFHRPQTYWRRTVEDPAYRSSLDCGRGKAIEIPECYRIRHTECGRDTAGLVM